MLFTVGSVSSISVEAFNCKPKFCYPNIGTSRTSRGFWSSYVREAIFYQIIYFVQYFNEKFIGRKLFYHTYKLIYLYINIYIFVKNYIHIYIITPMYTYCLCKIWQTGQIQRVSAVFEGPYCGFWLRPDDNTESRS